MVQNLEHLIKEKILNYYTVKIMQKKSDKYEIMVVGGTPAGIMAAVAAGRMGSRVILVEYHSHIGGMSTSGLGKSDIEKKESIAGLFKEFTQRVFKYYVDKYGENSDQVLFCKGGYYYEASVAELVFNQMIGEIKTITLIINHQIENVKMDSNKISGAFFKNRNNGELKFIEADVYIDATYEGDLYALAGAKYRLGREGKDEFNEEHAGRIFLDYNDNVFLKGSTGEADNRLTAYTYRLCLTDNPENSFELNEPPSGYNRSNYLKYFEDLKEGRLGPPKVFKEGHGYYPEHFNTMMRVFSFARIPNQKFDVNINPRPLAFPFVEENYSYLESDWNERERIFDRHRELVLGLLYFVQNDPEVPEEHRKIACKYHLPLDEFTDNQHFPWQLYVREGRRLNGLYTLNENDVRLQKDAKRNTIFYDSIISGEFPIDSFPVSKESSQDKKVLEGYIGLLEISPYQVPYRILVTENVENVIVPVAASTTHVAYSTIRMEPLWMGIGQAAGSAAHLACKLKVGVRDVPVHQLQKILFDNHQIITYFEDVELNDKAFKATQFWGTKGFFDSYIARTKEPFDSDELMLWINKLNELLNIKPSTYTLNGTGIVTISMFVNLIQQIVTNCNFIMSVNDVENSPALFYLDPLKWLYSSRDYSSSLMRGEAYIAFFNLFFAIKDAQ